MKKKYSKKWVGSIQPRKQRKYRANAPLHIKHKLMSVHLNDLLRRKYKKRNFPIRKGDSIKIMRGEFKSKTGKIENIDLKKLRVSITGINRTKKDGSKVGVYFNPSNLQIQELNLDDKNRIKAIERKQTEKKEKQQDKKEVKKETVKEKPKQEKGKKQENVSKKK